MASEQNSEATALRTDALGTVAASQGVTLINDTSSDALAYVHNSFWGSGSAGYVKAGKSVDLPTIVNVDAYVLLQNRDQGIFLEWPGPHVHYSKKKINLTPGQSYKISAFS